jgi:hypothetical protein
MMKQLIRATVCILATLPFFGLQSNAQEPPPISAEQEKQNSLADLFKTIDVSTISSLVFTEAEHREIILARRAAGKVRAPEASEGQGGVVPSEEERNIHLQGIVYTAKDDWVIWLNGKQITPLALPEEALAIEVYREYIEIKWYDDFTNQIIPLRLRPLQKFNIDTRMFLPG